MNRILLGTILTCFIASASFNHMSNSAVAASNTVSADTIVAVYAIVSDNAADTTVSTDSVLSENTTLSNDAVSDEGISDNAALSADPVISSDSAVSSDAAISENLVASENEAVSENTLSQNIASSIEDITKELSTMQKIFAEMPEKAVYFGIKAIIALIILFIGTKLIKLIRKIVKRSLQKGNAEAGVIQFLDSLIKFTLLALLCVFIASYFGLATTSLLAVLGSAGVTVALALQGSLSNCTGGVLILLLKPFKVGDYIHEDNKGNEGTVTEITLFYTKLRTIDDRTVILPNGTLANTSLTNVNESPFRRLIMTVGIAYEADIQKTKKVLEHILIEEDKVMKDKEINIYVDSLDSTQVTIGIRCFVKNEAYFDVKWHLTEIIKETFDREGIAIPFPQLDVHLSNEQES